MIFYTFIPIGSDGTAGFKMGIGLVFNLMRSIYK